MRYRLFHRDFLKAQSGKSPVKDRSVDVIVTSPDYNLGVCHTAVGHHDYLDFSTGWGRVAGAVLKRNGSLFVNLGYAPSEPMWPFEVVSAICVGGGFKVQSIIHWVKSMSVEEGGEVVSRGHFKPINSERLLNGCHEYIFHLSFDGKVPLDRLAIGVPYQDKSNVRRWGHTEGKDVRCRGDVWFMPYATIQNRAKDRQHPATFPVALPEMCLRLRGVDQACVVLDPFNGTGTTGVAAARVGAGRYVGFDIQKKWLDLSKTRIENERRVAR